MGCDICDACCAWEKDRMTCHCSHGWEAFIGISSLKAEIAFFYPHNSSTLRMLYSYIWCLTSGWLASFGRPILTSVAGTMAAVWGKRLIINSSLVNKDSLLPHLAVSIDIKLPDLQEDRVLKHPSVEWLLLNWWRLVPALPPTSVLFGCWLWYPKIFFFL